MPLVQRDERFCSNRKNDIYILQQMNEVLQELQLSYTKILDLLMPYLYIKVEILQAHEIVVLRDCVEKCKRIVKWKNFEW